MYKNAKDVGYSPDDFRRFSVLDRLEFSSVLDVGSGPCLLKQTLSSEKIYEAVDIREESLALCDCKTYNNIPSRKKYDLVCMFGVMAYGNKKEHLELLQRAAKRAKKYFVFSVINPFSRSGVMITYSKDEVLQMISSINPTTYTIDTVTEPTESIVICEI